MAELIETKTSALEDEILYQVYSDYYSEKELSRASQVDLDDDDDLEYLSVIPHPNDNDNNHEEELFDSQGMPTLSGDKYPLDNHYQNRQEGRMRGIDDLDDGFLTEYEIVNNLGLERGRAELQQILLEGAVARDTLIRSNIRLVISIAKRWARQSAKYNNRESSNRVSIYAGNAFTPSLDEAIQEGIVGLVRAADRYDPSRGLRFSTHCTYWITSFVRNCFTIAATGTLRVPPALHGIKVSEKNFIMWFVTTDRHVTTCSCHFSHSSLFQSKYHKIIKRCYYEGKEIPPIELIAEEIGCTVKRLETAIRATQQSRSLDEPVMGQSIRAGAGCGW
jgi:DNA-directed RNA polymerase sigma subunit (sigma70/sigma32)